MSTSPDSNALSQIEWLSELWRKKAKSIFGVDLDYSAESIARLEEMITKGWPEPPNLLDPLVEGLGSYLGETIRRLHGGEWRHTEEHGFFLDGLGGRDIQIFPMARARKRLLKGSDESVDYYYLVLKEQFLNADSPRTSPVTCANDTGTEKEKKSWWRRLFGWILGG
jgi:hypothetical protein